MLNKILALSMIWTASSLNSDSSNSQIATTKPCSFESYKFDQIPPELHAFINELCWENRETLFVDESFTEKIIITEKYREYFQDREIIIIFNEQQPIGFASQVMENDHTVCIDLVAIDAKYRNQKYGTYLLEHTIQALKANPNIQFVTIHTRVANEIARRLYRKIGFIEYILYIQDNRLRLYLELPKNHN